MASYLAGVPRPIVGDCLDRGGIVVLVVEIRYPRDVVSPVGRSDHGFAVTLYVIRDTDSWSHPLPATNRDGGERLTKRELARIRHAFVVEYFIVVEPDAIV